MLTSDTIHRLEGKRLFLTGGTGFFGKSILDYLKRFPLNRLSVIILSRHASLLHKQCPQLMSTAITCIDGDIRSFPFPQEPVDFILHAASPAVTDLPPGEQQSIICEGTRRCLEYAQACSAQRFLLASSGAVYGPSNGRPFREDDACRPLSEYGQAKLKAEQLCFQSDVSATAARCFAFVGPYLPKTAHFAIGNFIQNCCDGSPIVIRGDGTPVRSYLYADDLVEWLLTLLVQGDNRTAYNVGSPYGISIADLARSVRQALHADVPVSVLGHPNATDATNGYLPDVSRCNAMGLTVTVPLEEAIRRSVHEKS